MTKFCGVSSGRSTLGSIRHFFGWQFQIVIYLIDSQTKKMEKCFLKVFFQRHNHKQNFNTFCTNFNCISFQFNSSCMQSRVYGFKWFIMYVCNNSNDYLFKIIITFSEKNMNRHMLMCLFMSMLYSKIKIEIETNNGEMLEPYGNIWKK